jgi:tRNA nucleotidyltransferase/poly(A) polymerase
LRIIRALRFVAVLNQKLRNNAKPDTKIQLFDIETNTRSSLKTHTKLVENVSMERIKDEMMKVFIS